MFRHGSKQFGIIAARISFLPDNVYQEIIFSKHFVTEFSQMMYLMVIHGDKDNSVWSQQGAGNKQSAIHIIKPITVETTVRVRIRV